MQVALYSWSSLWSPFSTGQQGVESVCVAPILPWAQQRVWKPRHTVKEQLPCSSPRCGEILPAHSAWGGKRWHHRSCWFWLSSSQEFLIDPDAGTRHSVASQWYWKNTMRAIVHWNRLPGDVVGLPSLEICKTWLKTALSNLVYLTLLWARGWTRWSPEVPSSLNYSVSLWFYQSRYLHVRIKFQNVIKIILCNLKTQFDCSLISEPPTQGMVKCL